MAYRLICDAIEVIQRQLKLPQHQPGCLVKGIERSLAKTVGQTQARSFKLRGAISDQFNNSQCLTSSVISVNDGSSSGSSCCAAAALAAT